MAELLKWDGELEDKVVIDTNLLLDDSKILFKLTKKYKQIVIPITVLQELDKHKFKRGTAYSARQAIRALIEFKEDYKDRIIFDISGIDLEKLDTNDLKIIKCAKDGDATLATKDMAMDIIAEALEVKTKLYDVVLNNIFNPYIYIEQYKLFEINTEGVFGYGRHFMGKEYDEVYNLFNKASDRPLIRDSWFFVIINTPTSNPTVYAHNPTRKLFIKIDDNPEYRSIKGKKGEHIKARDIYQTCAIYALKEAQHVLITGKWGSGKTLLSTAQALTNDDKKVFITRAPIGLNSKYDIGFVPGDRVEKMQDWLGGFMSALYFLYGNTKGQVGEGNKGYDYVKEILFREKFEAIPINSIQGLSLLDNDTLIVDEVQLITVDYISMILSRPSETGRLILLGDLGQTYDVVKPSESGLLKLLRVLPHRSIAYVDLQNSYRSDILEVAELLQDKTIG